MNLKIVALAATITLAACGSREWRSKPGSLTPDLVTSANLSFPKFNPKDPSNVALLKSIGGASLTIVPRESNGSENWSNPNPYYEVKRADHLKIHIVLKDSCEDFEQLLPLSGLAQNDQEKPHGSFAYNCIGKGGSCDQVALLFSHTHEDKQANAVIVFTKNSKGKYDVSPAQTGGVLIMEVEQFQKGQCKPTEPAPTPAPAPAPAPEEQPQPPQPPLLSDK